MRVNDDLYMIPVAFEMPGRTMIMNLSLIVDPENGATLVDAAMPGSLDALTKALADDGFKLTDIKQIVITHQDVDHIGSLAAVKEATGATVYSHRIEAPYVEGKTPLVKMPSAEALAQDSARKAFFEGIGYSKVDRLVEDGDVLAFAGGVRVVFTPGHAPGHICLFLERSKSLITGDAMTSAEGQLNGPNVGATPDMPMAVASIKKLSGLGEIESIVTYHGGLVSEDATGQLARVVGELTA